ncbi:CRIB domain-containing protein RIC10 [Solanum pennellii]|uniref:CRIB domain-containing protein RIC10 n=1 Tax=Solanum pennellii TaxID=28526 RepID=A0ABM1HQD2_SOLPN|nr:CRIB domain-containing protein RIC10 [Solanum pennellii]XP_015088828.1 CRIB domain-containing protein RIC10 [Solanum pennellii]
MGNKMKGIIKGFKYMFNNFAVKERELEIGCPTDVKHVAHIGWDGQSGNAPSWMNQFKKGPDFAAASIGINSGSSLSPWTSQGVGESNEAQSTSETNKDSQINKEINVKKQRRRKSTPKSSSSSRASKSKAKFVKEQSKPTNIEVA